MLREADPRRMLQLRSGSIDTEPERARKEEWGAHTDTAVGKDQLSFEVFSNVVPNSEGLMMHCCGLRPSVFLQHCGNMSLVPFVFLDHLDSWER